MPTTSPPTGNETIRCCDNSGGLLAQTPVRSTHYGCAATTMLCSAVVNLRHTNADCRTRSGQFFQFLWSFGGLGGDIVV